MEERPNNSALPKVESCDSMTENQTHTTTEHSLSETTISEWSHFDSESLKSEDDRVLQPNSLPLSHYSNESQSMNSMGGRMSCGSVQFVYHNSSDACSSSDTDISYEHSHHGSPNVTNGEMIGVEYRLPIVGYEIMEERARFTVFKIQVEHKVTGHSWFVFRRYTDFVRLHKKLKEVFPTANLPLPPKKWLGDNFNPNFLDERLHGLQKFVKSILECKDISNNKHVRLFFCFDDPPGAHDTIEESRAFCENLEETVFQLQQQLKDKDSEIEQLQEEVKTLRSQQDALLSALRLECSLTAYTQSKLQNSVGKNTPIKVTGIKLPPNLQQYADEIQHLGTSIAEMNHSKSLHMPNDDSHHQEAKTNGV